LCGDLDGFDWLFVSTIGSQTWFAIVAQYAECT
jgi:hypothetical protein